MPKQPDITSAAALAVLKTLSAQKTMDMTPADISRRDLRLQAIERLEFDHETLALAITSLKELAKATGLIWNHTQQLGWVKERYDIDVLDVLQRTRIVLTRV